MAQFYANLGWFTEDDLKSGIDLVCLAFARHMDPTILPAMLGVDERLDKAISHVLKLKEAA